MPKKDLLHDIVVAALVKAGWIITNDPLVLPFGYRHLYVDLGAETSVAAEREGRKIAVEIKSFVAQSNLPEWERAVGQWFLYGFMLSRLEPERSIYLAVSDEVQNQLLQENDMVDFIAHHGIKIIVVNRQNQEIVQWIE